ncbi:MAG: DUF3540 domain-containing protein [Sandaracinaceae bacterium]|nr:DUF3540 domain-containing protein [Sandaracinaceae bacterium]
MTSTPSPLTSAPLAAVAPYRARVAAVTGPHTVRLADGASATLAAAGYAPAVGDGVLVLASEAETFVIGVLSALREAEATSDGVHAAIERDVLTVRGASGEVLFTHDARSGQSTVRGRDVRVVADAVALSGRTVQIDGAEAVRVTQGEQSLSLDPRGTTLTTRALHTEADEARLSFRDVVFGAGRVESVVDRARHAVEAVEITAGRIVERTKDVFREVEGVSQTRAGRLRLVTEGVFSVLSGRTSIEAEDDLSLVAERIELG